MKKVYTMIWRGKHLTDEAKTLDEMVGMLYAAAEELLEMKNSGVILEDAVKDDFAHLITTKRKVANKFGFLEEEPDEEEE